MSILVTGGTGYIGSHTCVELLNNGYHVIIADNLCNSEEQVVQIIEKITGKKVPFYPYDLCEKKLVRELFEKEPNIEGVIHFAGLKAVGESVEKPLLYYQNNIEATVNILEEMGRHKVKRFVFSSSATVYGDPAALPIKEDFPLHTTNPYGATKLMQENILNDLWQSDSEWGITLLRYFNPVGAHESGLLRENPKGIPNNLMPFIVQVAQGKLKKLNVFGNDYDTPDGTGIRDFIHVMDLAAGHVAALKQLERKHDLYIYNLGTGKGTSVMELVKTFERCNHVKIPYEITARRAGDIAQCYADSSKAEKELAWQATKNVEDMCCDSWKAAVTSSKE